MKKLTPAKKGLITGLVMAGTAMIFYYILNKTIQGPYQYAIYGLYTLGIIWSLADFNSSAEGKPLFKEYFLTGFKTFVVVTLVMVAFVAIFFSLNTEIRDQGIAENKKLLIEEGNKTMAEIDAFSEQMKSKFLMIIISITLFMYLFLGALITAATAGVMIQKKRN